MKCGFAKHFSTVRGPKLSTHDLKKVLENPHFIFCSSFHNLRLGGVNFPNEDLGRIDNFNDKRGNPDFEGSTFQGREY